MSDITGNWLWGDISWFQCNLYLNAQVKRRSKGQIYGSVKINYHWYRLKKWSNNHCCLPLCNVFPRPRACRVNISNVTCGKIGMNLLVVSFHICDFVFFINILSIFNVYVIITFFQPSGLLSYLDSADEIPEKERDRLHNRDNVKLASEAFNRNRKNPHWKLIEKQLENVLVHWRARIGMEKKQVR